MARGRMISQSINLDPQFNQLSAQAQLMFLRSVPFLDRDGLIHGNPVALWAKIAPLMNEFQALMPGIVSEWKTAGLVVAYLDRGREVLWFKGFRKNQTGMRYDREAPSDFAPPPGYMRGSDDFVPAEPPQPESDSSETTTDELRTNSGSSPAQVEVKLRGSVRGSEAQDGGKQPPQQPSPADLANGRTRGEVARHRALAKMPHLYPGIEPRLLTHLANEVKRIRGMPSLIEKPGRDEIEDELRKLAYDLYQDGYTTPASLQELHAEWKQYACNFKDPVPYPRQLYEFAVRLRNQAVEDMPATVLNFSVEELI